MLTLTELPSLEEAYNMLSRIFISLTIESIGQAFSLVVAQGHGQGILSTDGRHGAKGRGCKSCTYCGKLGHIESTC
jgi:hypothetical protein